MHTVRRLSTAMYNRMHIPREKGLAPTALGVYPRSRELPSPVCCFRIMHIRSGALWIAYCEMLWVTSQMSFWAAQTVTGGWNMAALCLGFLSVIIQIIFIVYLIKGIRHFRLSLLNIYMFGLTVRILVFITMLIILLFIAMIDSKGNSSLKALRRFIWLKIMFLTLWIGLKLFALISIRRCHNYIKLTKDFFRTPDAQRCTQPKVVMTESGSHRREYMPRILVPPQSKEEQTETPYFTEAVNGVNEAEEMSTDEY